MPDHVRMEWLIGAGFSGSELKEALDSIEQDKKDRRTSITKSDFQDKADVLAENVKRKFGRVLGRRQRTDTLYKEWKQKKEVDKMKRRSSI